MQTKEEAALLNAFRELDAVTKSTILNFVQSQAATHKKTPLLRMVSKRELRPHSGQQPTPGGRVELTVVSAAH